MQSNSAARVRGVGIAALAPGAVAAAASGIAGAGPADAATPTPDQPQPLHATFKRHHILAGRRLPVTGTLLTHEARRRGLLQMRRAGRRWHTVDRAGTGKLGRFRLGYRPHGLGRYRLRVRLVGAVLSPASGPAGASAGRTQSTVTVYRESLASWYGPGFIGGRTACGRTLGPGTLGVANRVLPCGTRVTLRYHDRTARVPVIDRGPYAGACEWDLTPATKARLHFPSTGVIWSTR